MESPSSKYTLVVLKISRVDPAGIGAAFMMWYAVLDLYRSTVTFADADPSTFEIKSVLTLKTLPDAAELVTIAVALVPIAWTAVFPVIVPTETMLGAAINYPNTIAIAIALPVEIPGIAGVWYSNAEPPEFTVRTCPAVPILVSPVPPLATGRVPVTLEVKSTEVRYEPAA
jgi:hypothetical protein